MGQNKLKCGLLFTILTGLVACSELGVGSGEVTRTDQDMNGPRFGLRAGTEKELAESQVITGLIARRSVLPAGSPYDEVASAVLAASSRAAESELRAARLRAEAASTNWVPRIGPDISLTSLSTLAATLVLETTLFDYGRRKAEREFAKADVEVAAVALSEDSNDRVFEALELYLEAQRGIEGARLDQATLKDMRHFLYIITERVEGGVSDRSELNVIRQEVAEIQASLAANQDSTRTALAELNAMASHSLDGVAGIAPVGVNSDQILALSVVKAQAEQSRAIASAKINRADALPGITARVGVGDNDTSVIGTEGTVGLGTGAQLKAIELAREAAARQVAQAEEDSARTLRRLESQVAARDRQAAEAANLAAEAKRNLDLFQDQYDAGRRKVTEVVQVYQTFSTQQERAIALKYEAAAARLDVARVLGVLADGESI